jgi:ADP-heptose:LPS heptosyltransferase
MGAKLHEGESRGNENRTSKKILIISLDYIGDYIMRTIPAIRAIKRKFPDSSITIMAGSWTENLILSNPHVERTIVYDPRWLDRSDKIWGFFKKMTVLNSVRKERFDIIVHVRGSLGTAALCIVKQSNLIINSKELLTDAMVGEFKKNRSDLIRITDEERLSAKKLLIKEGVDISKRIISIYPGANSAVKRWDAAKWAKLCDALIERYDAALIICGSQNDVRLAGEIAGGMRRRAINITGKTTLLQLAAIIDRSGLCIAIDSGPMHIAGFFGAPLVALFGPNDPKDCAPLTDKMEAVFKNLPCVKCCIENAMDCGKECMNTITVGDVLAKVGILTERHGCFKSSGEERHVFSAL